MSVPMVVITLTLGIMSLMATIIGFFAARTLKKVDTNQERLFVRVDALDKKISWLEGQHELLACRKIT